MHSFLHAVRELQSEGYNVSYEIFVANLLDNNHIPRVQTFLTRQGSCPRKGICHAVIGPAFSSQSKAIADIAKLLRLPMVSFSATSPELVEQSRIDTVDKKLEQGKYPYFARVVPADNVQAAVMKDMLVALGYSSANIIFTSESYGRGLYEALEKRFASMGGRLAVVRAINQWEASTQTDEVFAALKGSDSRVTMAAISSSTQPLILEKMLQRGTLTSGWVWLLSEAFLRQLYSHKNRQQYAGVFIPFMMSTPDRLRSSINISYHLTDMGMPYSVPNLTSAAVGNAAWSPFVYDATRVVASAASTMADPSDGEGLMRRILAAKYNGSTGLVSFTPSGERARMDFFVYNVRLDSSVDSVATWTGDGKLTIDLERIVWPGGKVGASGKPTGTASAVAKVSDYIGFGSSLATVLVLAPDSFGDGVLGYAVRLGVELAVSHARRVPELREAAKAVVFRFRDSGCDRWIATRSFMNQTEEQPRMLAVIGCHCSSASVPLALLTGAISIPQIGIDSWASELSDLSIYPYFFRLSADNCRVSAIVAQMCLSFGWLAVSVVAPDDSYGRDAVERFSGLAGRPDVSIRIHRQILYEIHSNGPDTAHLASFFKRVKQSSSRIMYVCALSSEHLSAIADVGAAVGVLGEGWQWLFTESGNIHNSTLRAMLKGGIWFELKQSTSELPSFGAMRKTIMDAEVDRKDTVMTVVDIVLVLLTAFSTQLANLTQGTQVNSAEREQLASAIGRVSLAGLTGDTAFNKQGDRKVIRFTLQNQGHASAPHGIQEVAQMQVMRKPGDASMCGMMPDVIINWKWPNLEWKGLIFGGGTKKPPRDILPDIALTETGISVQVVVVLVGGLLVLFGCLTIVAMVAQRWTLREKQRKKAQRQETIETIERRLSYCVRMGDSEGALMHSEKLRKISSRDRKSLTILMSEMERQHSIEGGVSVAYLVSQEFVSLVVDMGCSEKSTFYELEKAFFSGEQALGVNTPCPRDGLAGCALVDYIPRFQRGKCTHFMSWTWGYSVHMLQESLRHWIERCSASDDETFLYCCFFCNNQYRIQSDAAGQGSKDLEQVFRQKLLSIGRVVAVLDTWDRPRYLTRIWTIFEQFTAVDLQLPIEMILPPAQQESLIAELEKGIVGIDKVVSALTQIDSKNAEAFNPADKEKVKALISDSIGFEALNCAVAKNLSQWIGEEVRMYFDNLVLRETSQTNDIARQASKDQVVLATHFRL